MTKVDVYTYKRQLLVLLFVAFMLPLSTYSQYKMLIIGVDKDSSFIQTKLALQNNFKNRSQCIEYLYKIPELLKGKGYPNSSIDSVEQDSLSAVVHLYIGEAFRGAEIKTDSIDQKIMEGIGWNKKKIIESSDEF